jgi:hypothetical protein
MKKLIAIPAVALAAGLGLAACGPGGNGSSPFAGSLLTKIPGCSQPQTWGGDSLLGTSGNGDCSLDSGALSGETVKALIWPAGDTTDQDSYANSGSLVGPGPCTIGGSSPVPWVVTVQISDYAPDYATTVYQTIASVTGGTSMGPQGSCIGTGTPIAAPTPTTAPPAAAPAPTTAAPVAPAPTTPAPAPAQSGVLPDSSQTPGATNPDVTQANIGSTICTAGWTATVRPSESYTEDLKRQQLDGGYAVNGDTSLGDYEEDHLIPLELGGSPSSPQNLWPEEHPSSYTKDGVENTLNHAVCDGRVTLAAAQQAIASNWTTAEANLGVS